MSFETGVRSGLSLGDLIDAYGKAKPVPHSTRAVTDRVYGERQVMKLKRKMTPEASNVYRIRSDKATFDPAGVARC